MGWERRTLGLRTVFAVFAVMTLLQLTGLLVVTNARMDAAERATEASS